MTISAVTSAPPPPGFRLIDGAVVDQIIKQLNLTIAAVNAGGGSGSYTNLTVTGNSLLGNAVTDTIGLYGVAGVVQPASAAQAAVATGAITALATTAVTQSSPYGFATQAQGDAIATQVNLIITQGAALVALANAIRTAMVALGSMKGAA